MNGQFVCAAGVAASSWGWGINWGLRPDGAPEELSVQIHLMGTKYCHELHERGIESADGHKPTARSRQMGRNPVFGVS